MILHVVFYQPKPSATPQERQDLVTSLERASREIPTIRQVRVGRAADFGVGYEDGSISLKMEFIAVFDFMDLQGLKDYIQHPAHSRLSEVFWNICEKTLIVDVEAWDPRLPEGLNKLLVE